MKWNYLSTHNVFVGVIIIISVFSANYPGEKEANKYHTGRLISRDQRWWQLYHKHSYDIVVITLNLGQSIVIILTSGFALGFV